MKKLVMVFLVLTSFFTFAEEKVRCSLSTNDEEVFFSVIDLENGIALIGFSGDEIEDAIDEFELRHQVNQDVGDEKIFKSNDPKDYPGKMSLVFNAKTMTQTASFISEGEKINFSGDCKIIK